LRIVTDLVEQNVARIQPLRSRFGEQRWVELSGDTRQ
jgi:hypothetical protein